MIPLDILTRRHRQVLRQLSHAGAVLFDPADSATQVTHQDFLHWTGPHGEPGPSRATVEALEHLGYIAARPATPLGYGRLWTITVEGWRRLAQRKNDAPPG